MIDNNRRRENSSSRKGYIFSNLLFYTLLLRYFFIAAQRVLDFQNLDDAKVLEKVNTCRNPILATLIMIPTMVQALSAYRFTVVRDVIAEGEKLIVSPQSFVTRTASSQQLERTTSFYVSISSR